MIQRLSKKQIFKLGKKSYKNKQSGGVRWNPFGKKKKQNNKEEIYSNKKINEMLEYSTGNTPVPDITEPKKQTWYKRKLNQTKAAFSRTKKKNKPKISEDKDSFLNNPFGNNNNFTTISEEKSKPNPRHQTLEQATRIAQAYLNNNSDMPMRPQIFMSKENKELYKEEIKDLENKMTAKLLKDIQKSKNSRRSTTQPTLAIPLTSARPLLETRSQHPHLNTKKSVLHTVEVKEKDLIGQSMTPHLENNQTPRKSTRSTSSTNPKSLIIPTTPLLETGSQHSHLNTKKSHLNSKEKPKKWMQRKKSQARNAYRRTKKIIGNVYSKAKEATKRRFAVNKDKINKFIEKLKELIKKFGKQLDPNKQINQYLVSELKGLPLLIKKENNRTKPESVKTNSTTHTSKSSNIILEGIPKEPSFYNNEFKTDSSKIREITERIDNYIQHNKKYVTLQEIENYYTILDGNIPKVNTNAKKVIDYINDKLNEIDTYFTSINLDEAISVSTVVNERPDLKKHLETIKDYKNHKKNIKEILQRITKYSKNKTMYEEIDAMLETHYKNNNNNNNNN